MNSDCDDVWRDAVPELRGAPSSAVVDVGGKVGFDERSDALPYFSFNTYLC